MFPTSNLTKIRPMGAQLTRAGRNDQAKRCLSRLTLKRLQIMTRTDYFVSLFYREQCKPT